MPIKFVRNDITKMECDAIVNAANRSLLGGGGVDGAIHDAAGPELLEECRTLGGCETGRAKITKGYNLPAAYVIHTVGPIWRDGKHGEQELLASCYRESLRLARENSCETVAFPIISAGAYGFPKDQALHIAVSEISRFLLENEMTVYLVVYDKKIFQISRQLISDIEEYIDENYIDRNPYRRNRPVYGVNGLYFDEADFSADEDPYKEEGLYAEEGHFPEEELSDASRPYDEAGHFPEAEPGSSLPSDEAGYLPEEKTSAASRPSDKEGIVVGAARRIKKLTGREKKIETAGKPAAAGDKADLYLESRKYGVPAAAGSARPASAKEGGLSDMLRHIDESFSQMLLRKIDEKGMTDVECYKKANIDRKLFSKIRSDVNYRPSKTTAIAFAIALELPMWELKDMLMKAGFALSHSSKFDIIIEYFVNKGQYDIYTINETLFEFDQVTL